MTDNTFPVDIVGNSDRTQIGFHDDSGEHHSIVTAETNAVTGRVKFGIGGGFLPSDVSRFSIPSTLNASQIGNSIVATLNSFARYACNASSGRFALLENLGVSGNNSAMVLARIGTISPSADVVFYLEGVNDATTAVTFATHASNTIASLRAILATGKTPVLVLAPPSNTYAARVESINVIDFVIAQQLGIPCVSPFDFAVDVANGAYASGTTYASDGMHPNDSAHTTAGGIVWTALSSSVSPYIPLPRSNVGGVNAALLSSNPLFLTDSNADGVPDNWIKSGTGTVSLVLDGLKGSWLTVSQSAAATSIAAYQDVSTGYSVGDEVLLVCRAKLETMSNCNAVLALYDNNSLTSDRAYWWQDVTSNVSEQVVYLKHVVTPGTTSLRLLLQIGTSAGGNFTGKISVSQMQVYNLTQLTALIPAA